MLTLWVLLHMESTLQRKENNKQLPPKNHWLGSFCTSIHTKNLTLCYNACWSKKGTQNFALRHTCVEIFEMITLPLQSPHRPSMWMLRNPTPKDLLHAKVSVDKFWIFIKIESINPTNVKSPHVKKEVSKIFTKDLVTIDC
jgi:hypothetical protein